MCKIFSKKFLLFMGVGKGGGGGKKEGAFYTEQYM